MYCASAVGDQEVTVGPTVTQKETSELVAESVTVDSADETVTSVAVATNVTSQATPDGQLNKNAFRRILKNI